MEGQSETQEPNPNPKIGITRKEKSNKLQKQKNNGEYEFCKVCRLNQDQGKRHKYLPNHKKSLATFLSRFQAKLSDIRFFFKNPTPLRPEHASFNRFWCVFCDMEVDEIGSSLACSNAIDHLASALHLKNLKHFLWKNGGEMDRLDSFRIVEADLAKWKKKCKSMMSEAVSSTGGSHGPLLGPSNNIQNEIVYENVDSFEKSSIHSLKSSLSNGVMPLQYTTNEYQVSHSGISGVRNVGQFLHDSSLHVDAHSGKNLWNSNDIPVDRNSQHALYVNDTKSAADSYFNNGGEGRVANGQSSSHGLQNLTQIVPLDFEPSKGNVHSGAPPPWLGASEENLLQYQVKPVLHSLVSSSTKSGKSRKLNPKRVGAAWAEKRKMELEMERRGEVVKNNCGADWLPNFGRVWQSGSRKESRKEFEMEKPKLTMVENQSEMPMDIQPYISKRMRKDTNK